MVKRQKNLEGDVISTTKFQLKHVNYKQAVELVKQDMIDQCLKRTNLTFVNPSGINSPIVSLSRARSPLFINTHCQSPAVGSPSGDDTHSMINDADLDRSYTKLSFNKTTDQPIIKFNNRFDTQMLKNTLHLHPNGLMSP